MQILAHAAPPSHNAGKVTMLAVHEKCGSGKQNSCAQCRKLWGSKTTEPHSHIKGVMI